MCKKTVCESVSAFTMIIQNVGMCVSVCVGMGVRVCGHVRQSVSSACVCASVCVCASERVCVSVCCVCASVCVMRASVCVCLRRGYRLYRKVWEDVAHFVKRVYATSLHREVSFNFFNASIRNEI